MQVKSEQRSKSHRMETEMQYNNNNYYSGRGTGGGGSGGPTQQSYLPYPPQQHPEPATPSQNIPINHMRSNSQTQLCNNHTWLPTSSSNSSSDNNSSPSSSSVTSSGGGGGNLGNYRNPSNSNYYLQNFGQQKNNWEFMNHVQRQIHENYGYHAGETANSTSATSSSSHSSVTSTSPSVLGPAAYPGGSQRKSGPSQNYLEQQQQLQHQQQHQQNQQMQQHHYANTLHYHQQQMLHLASG